MNLRSALPLVMTFSLAAAALPPVSSAAEEEASVAAPKPKRPKRKKGYDYEKSKYKAYKALTGPEEKTYRFDDKGNPIRPAVKKKTVRKKGKPMPPDDEAAEPGKHSEEAGAEEAAPRKTSVKRQEAPRADVYVCSMGDYEGPLTKDGRCPKCGMDLQKRK